MNVAGIDHKEAATAVAQYLAAKFGQDNVRVNPEKRLTVIEVKQGEVWRAVLAVGSPPRPGRPGRDYFTALKGKKITITLHDGKETSGVLAGFNPYDLLLKGTTRHSIVLKHAITAVRPAEDEQDPFAEEKKGA